MTPKFIIGAATAATLSLGAAVAFAQSVYDPSVRKEIDPGSIAADKPIFWQRDASGALILDARGQPIPLSPAPSYTPSQVSVDASTVTVDPAPAYVDYSMPARVELVASAPVPDTPANRVRFGGPESNAGQRTTPRGN